jgi:hypothetical protein
MKNGYERKRHCEQVIVASLFAKALQTYEHKRHCEQVIVALLFAKALQTPFVPLFALRRL